MTVLRIPRFQLLRDRLGRHVRHVLDQLLAIPSALVFEVTQGPGYWLPQMRHVKRRLVGARAWILRHAELQDLELESVMRRHLLEVPPQVRALRGVTNRIGES